MEMYEQNYIRLRCLCPAIRQLEGEHISQIPGAHDLHLNILEQARHTTTLQLTYIMENGERRPDVTLRIYHDALQAEVLSRRCQLNGAWMKAERSPTMAALECKWKINRFLYKWLNYCGRQGHSFATAREALTSPA
jgi:uncharacterized protein YqiB (DUF1249 family)